MGCGVGAILGNSQLSGLGDKWGVVLPKRTEGREEAAGGRGGGGGEVTLCLGRSVSEVLRTAGGSCIMPGPWA